MTSEVSLSSSMTTSDGTFLRISSIAALMFLATSRVFAPLCFCVMMTAIVFPFALAVKSCSFSLSLISARVESLTMLPSFAGIMIAPISSTDSNSAGTRTERSIPPVLMLPPGTEMFWVSRSFAIVATEIPLERSFTGSTIISISLFGAPRVISPPIPSTCFSLPSILSSMIFASPIALSFAEIPYMMTGTIELSTLMIAGS